MIMNFLLLATLNFWDGFLEAGNLWLLKIEYLRGSWYVYTQNLMYSAYT